MATDAKHIHESFGTFVRRVVLPMHLANPDHLQLDGLTTGGNRDVAGRFQYSGKVWKVHMDTRYEPLLLCYYAWEYLLQEKTFVEAETPGSGIRLDLASEVSAVRPVGHRYLYIYLDAPYG